MKVGGGRERMWATDNWEFSRECGIGREWKKISTDQIGPEKKLLQNQEKTMLKPRDTCRLKGAMGPSAGNAREQPLFSKFKSCIYVSMFTYIS